MTSIVSYKAFGQIGCLKPNEISSDVFLLLHPLLFLWSDCTLYKE